MDVRRILLDYESTFAPLRKFNLEGHRFALDQLKKLTFDQRNRVYVNSNQTKTSLEEQFDGIQGLGLWYGGRISPS